MMLLLLASTLLAQDDAGARIFRQTCAQGYCHGAGGTQGRAPKLLGRAYEPAAALKIISDGVANTGMPGFKDRLNATELNAVLAYVVTISGGDASKLPAAAGAPGRAPALSAEAKQGRELFFDAVRGVNRCGTCHALDSLGIAIGPNLATGAKYDVAAIRKGKPATVRLATLKTESFPALVVERTAAALRLYDLSAMPPPLRTFTPAEVTLGPAPKWSHASVIGNYSENDLAAIAAWLDQLNR
jgi:mono/diheme cytochrome c family protein